MNLQFALSCVGATLLGRTAIVALSMTMATIPGLLMGQTTGTILGQVVDPSGAAVVGATAKADNLCSRLVRRAVTSNDGVCLIAALPMGAYRITVENAGFKAFSQTGITLQVGQNAPVDVALAVGAVTKSVNVSGAAVSVDTQSTTNRGNGRQSKNREYSAQREKRIGAGPTDARRGAADLPTAYTFSRSGPTISVSGSRLNQNNIMLDGTTLIGAMGNVGQNLPSPDTLQVHSAGSRNVIRRSVVATGGDLTVRLLGRSNHVSPIAMRWDLVTDFADPRKACRSHSGPTASGRRWSCRSVSRATWPCCKSTSVRVKG